ncbi:hypothetical protein GOP47_0012604 [Adiantum capillus-veneris]|uniref:DUF4005 domain-containing protein n=1 Tax=Adiantum capillus-veneris TaxID=13818 RepID=A0A9D4USD5_ADICA|nr:hypothetical protein GOP47_0012604 [Adiantum capillus-veneris]
MGKKGGWLNAVKKAFSPSRDVEKEVKPQKDRQPKNLARERKRWGFGKSPPPGEALMVQQEAYVDATSRSEKMTSISEKSMSVAEEEQNSHALAVAAATAAAAEAAVAAAQAAAEVVRLTGGGPHSSSYFLSRSREDRAALKIQAAFRGYLARRAFRALKGLMRLQALVRGHTVSRQATVTLRCMQSLVRVQTQVRERRNRKSEEQQHLEKGFSWQESQHQDAISKRSLSDASHLDGWDGSVHSADEVQAKLQFKEEAMARRERALAYAYSHQLWKSGAIPESMLLAAEHDNGHWDWNWLEKWMAGRSWDGHAVTKEIPDVSSLKSHEELQPDSAYTHTSTQKWQPSSTPVPMSPARSRISKPLSYAPPPSSAHQYSRPAISAKGPPAHLLRSQNFTPADKKDGEFLKTRSSGLVPVASKGSSKQSTTSSSAHDDDEFRPVPSYMASTKSAQARSRSQSTPKQRSTTPERENVTVTVKKRLSYPISGSLIGSSGPLKSSGRQQGPQRSPGLRGISGPLHLYHSYNDVSIGSIASLNGQTRRRFK